MAVSFKGAHFPPEVILMGVRWYVAYPLSTRHVEELMEERGVNVDHSTVNRWVRKGRLPKPVKRLSGMVLFDRTAIDGLAAGAAA